MVRCASDGRNPYAAALDVALGGTRGADTAKSRTRNRSFAPRAGRFEGLTLRRPGEVIARRPSAYEAGGDESGVRRPVASVFVEFGSVAEFLEARRKADRWISVRCS